MESPDGEAIIWKSGNKVFCVGTVFPSIDFLFQSINCFAALRMVVACHEILNELVSVFAVPFDVSEEHDF